jgi:hypothetical protein
MSDSPELESTRATSDVMKKPAGPIRRPSLALRPSIPDPQSAAPSSRPPMRVLVPPSQRPSSITAKRTHVVRPSARQSPTTGGLPKPVVAVPKIVGKSTVGARRILVQASDKPTRTASASTIPAPKTQGPQRVLIQTASSTTNPGKKPLGLSSSANPPAPASRLPSRIAMPSTSKMTRTSSIPKPAGRWV